jgi:Protein of unknown function (DUF433)
MILPDFLSQDNDGYIHVAGHRIGLQDLVYYYNEGHSAEALVDMFPTLTLALSEGMAEGIGDEEIGPILDSRECRRR